MIDRYRRWVTRLMRVPEEPDAPAGDPTSVRIFRAGPSYLSYKRTVWGLGQLAALVGLLAGILIPRQIGWDPGGVDVGDLDLAFWMITTGAAVIFVPQAVFSYAVIRLDYDLRWYILTDRALRIRQGVVVVREQTLTFANIQEIEVKRNLIQRLLGLSDVEVRTAGGGGAGPGGRTKKGYASHQGILRGVADGPGIRDAIRDRVRRYRSAGLGDPDDEEGAQPQGGAGLGATSGTGPTSSRIQGALSAAREVGEEVRGLRSDLQLHLP